jgi:L-methionine (R)-S-oxide reductase
VIKCYYSLGRFDLQVKIILDYYLYAMADDLKLTATTKEERYKELLPQLTALIDGETDVIANMANLCAALKFSMNFFWVGFYLIKEKQLVLGPFQGPVACTRINKGKGVCGMAWKQEKVIRVDDVDKFPGHIACSSLSKSELVIPIFNQHKEIVGVLDVDSDVFSDFDSTDELYLTSILLLLKL